MKYKPLKRRSCPKGESELCSYSPISCDRCLLKPHLPKIRQCRRGVHHRVVLLQRVHLRWPWCIQVWHLLWLSKAGIKPLEQCFPMNVKSRCQISVSQPVYPELLRSVPPNIFGPYSNYYFFDNKEILSLFRFFNNILHVSVPPKYYLMFCMQRAKKGIFSETHLFWLTFVILFL